MGKRGGFQLHIKLVRSPSLTLRPLRALRPNRHLGNGWRARPARRSRPCNGSFKGITADGRVSRDCSRFEPPVSPRGR